jgi:hypothetical protein
MRRIFVLTFFLAQVFGIIYARFLDVRYFCWAPFDQISTYVIEAEINGVVFTPGEIKKRYTLEASGRENRSIHNVFSIIRQAEESYGKGDRAAIRVIFSANGKEKEEWIFNTE